jgi:TusE/DsrC/DsvC family sulfur relay protein
LLVFYEYDIITCGIRKPYGNLSIIQERVFSVMAQMELAGKMYEVDEHGFMQETPKWNQEIALAYAVKEGVTHLTEDHWKAINYLRNYYLANGICPMIRRLIKETGFTLKKLYDLFPEGPANSACKWAGVPKATGCV